MAYPILIAAVAGGLIFGAAKAVHVVKHEAQRVARAVHRGLAKKN